jgi:predicted HTH transcriptional regulator
VFLRILLLEQLQGRWQNGFQPEEIRPEVTESNRIEYKRQLTEHLEREVVAFLNSGEGGVIYLGIDKNGNMIGIEDSDSQQLTIKDRLKNNIRPSIMGLFEIEHEERDGLDLIRVTVAGGLERPYYLKKYGMTEKGCFLRVGSASDPMPAEMIESFYGKRVRNTIGRMDSPRQDLSFEQLKIYYDARGLVLGKKFLTHLELLTPDGKPNYAAYLLADENGASFQVAKYSGSDRVDLVENRDYGRYSLVKALKSMLERVEVENTVFTKITYPLRQETELINSIAVREAIINAVVHNDYSYGSTPKVEFFSDRAEVTSMGGLPYGVTEADFFGGCSVPRNKEIMRVLRDLEIVEHLGSGVPRIVKAYGKEAFEIRDSYVRIVFPYAKMDQAGTKLGPSRDQVKILHKCLVPSKIGELMEVAGRANRTKFRDQVLKPLMEAEYISMTIPDKPTSRNQQYQTTAIGKAALKDLNP